RHADATGGHELSSDESMRGDRLDCGSRGSSRASSRSGESRSAGDIRKLAGRWHGDDAKRPVVGGDSDSRESHGLSGRESILGGGINGYEKTVFGCPGGAGGDHDGSGLRGAVWTRG